MENEKIGGVLLDYTYYTGEDSYSDGDIEDSILDIVKEHEPSEYRSIIKSKNSWPVLYHLSPVRENIIGWFNVPENASILEVGSGCGAMTGALIKKNAKVSCIELSRRRSLINAYRHKNAENLHIFVGNFTDIEPNLPEKYDLITLNGVLEYAALYVGKEGDGRYEPYVRLLKLCISHLKENGKLVVAIENKYGLKYWAGCAEDHFGKKAVGIENYADTKGIRTFSKKELENLFKSAGVENAEFYYPYPDYKLPFNIYSDRRLPLASELNNNIVNYDNDRYVFFDEAKAYDGLLEEEMFPYFSNSYFAALSLDGKTIINDNPVFVRFSNDRKDEFALKTEIWEKDGQKTVVKSAITDKANVHIKNIKEAYDALNARFEGSNAHFNSILDSSPESLTLEFVEGDSYANLIAKAENEGNFDEALKLIDEMVSLIRYGGKTPFKETKRFREMFSKLAAPTIKKALDEGDFFPAKKDGKAEEKPYSSLTAEKSASLKVGEYLFHMRAASSSDMFLRQASKAMLAGEAAAEDAGNGVFGMTFEDISCSTVTDLDLIAQNVIRGNDGKVSVIDYEWTFDFPIPADFVVYRMLFFLKPGHFGAAGLSFEKLCERYGISEKAAYIYSHMEEEFQKYVSGELSTREMVGVMGRTARRPEEIEAELTHALNTRWWKLRTFIKKVIK